MTKFPIRYKEKYTYAMGECEVYYTIHDTDDKFLFTVESCKEKEIKEFVENVNRLYENRIICINNNK